MKVLYIINSKEFPYHTKILDDFKKVIDGEVIDMTEGADDGERFAKVSQAAADVIITFDCSGMQLRTSSDTLSLNNIYARFAHILFHDPSFYGRTLYARQNLSMFTYVPAGTDKNKCTEKYPLVPSFEEFPGFFYKADSDDEHEKNRESIGIFWDDFRKAAML